MRNLIISIGVLFGTFVLLVHSSDNNPCIEKAEAFCTAEQGRKLEGVIGECNAKYSGINHVSEHLQNYVTLHIAQSYKYLMMSTLFSSYVKNREGFEKLYKKLSDETWTDAIEITKYMAKRGLSMNLDFAKLSGNTFLKGTNFPANEIHSLSVALNLHKNLAEEGHKIHGKVTHPNCRQHSNLTKVDCERHDSEVESFIENTFVHKHADTVRTLAGHITDLARISETSSTEGPQLQLYLFDQYLQKTV